jgi:hypothetical protein
MGHEKKYNHNQLNAEGKAILIIWLNNHKELCETLPAHNLIRKFNDETGLIVSPSSMQTYRNAVFPNLEKKAVGGHLNGGKLLAMITDLNNRVTALEELMK